MKIVTVRGVSLALVIGVATSVAAQRPLPPITGTEILAAFATTADTPAKHLAIARATQLPAHALSDATVAAIAADLQRIVAAHEKVMIEHPIDPITGTPRGLDANATCDERGEGSDYEPELIQILAREGNPAAIDALAEVVDTGRMAEDAVVQFGDAAVPPLLRVARVDGPYRDYFYRTASALNALEQMLESKDIRPTLSADSLQAIRQLVRERIANSGERWMVLASAAYLGVATGDQDLRTRASSLIDDNAEFVRRGIDARWQQWVSNRLREALARFPEPESKSR